jgi:hypothetical protein
VLLSQIPYTGLDLGPVGTTLYWLMLILWSAAAAYLILFGAFPLVLRRAKSFGGNVKEALNQESAAPAVPMPTPTYAAPEPVAHIQPIAVAAPAMALEAPEPVSSYQEYIQKRAAVAEKPEGFRSFASGQALSIDDIVKGLSRESGMVFSTPEGTAPAAPQPVQPAPAPVQETPAAPVAPAYVPAAFVPSPASQPATLVSMSDDIPGFVAALLAGDRDTVFNSLRSVVRAGGDSQEFLSQAVCALDDAYRARIDGSSVHPEIARITEGCATSFLERVVVSLTQAVDSSYSTGITGAKLALTRVLALVNG